MLPPIYNICRTNSEVTALLGTDPLRVYSFGLAPQGVHRPYVVWQTINGSPENYLGSVPDTDSYSVQIDIYSDRAAGDTGVTNIARALRDAFEPHGYITAWGNTSREPATLFYRYTFTVDLIQER